MTKLLIVLSLILTGCASMFSGIKTKELKYSVDGVDHVGYISSGATKEKKGKAVLIVHEWWGHNEYVRTRADMLAKQGYVAMAIDMYGEGKTADHPKKAGEFAGQVMSNMAVAKKRFNTALEILKNREDVDATKVAAIGYCFGGGIVINMIRNKADLELAASFHGSLKASKKRARNYKNSPKLLVFNGKADPMVTSKDIKSFKKEMKRARIDYEFYNYEGAKHAFTNKKADGFGKRFKLPLAYDQKADNDSWSVLLKNLATM